ARCSKVCLTLVSSSPPISLSNEGPDARCPPPWSCFTGASSAGGGGLAPQPASASERVPATTIDPARTFMLPSAGEDGGGDEAPLGLARPLVDLGEARVAVAPLHAARRGVPVSPEDLERAVGDPRRRL